MLDLIELVKPPGCGEVKYVFFDTGLEWDATLRHVAEAERRYGVTIERRKPKIPIPLACKKTGIPFYNKDMSQKLATLQHNDFDFNADGRGIEHLALYKWWRGGRPARQSSQYDLNPKLREFLISQPPDFAISDRCCRYAKKNPAKEFYKEFIPDLDIQGVRKAEGGPRAGAYKNCFDANPNSFDKYRPLWFWTDEDKRTYKEWRGIAYSDCYEIWGFARTGCVGCPCCSLAAAQLESARQYEPKKVKAAYFVFGKSYAYRGRYNQFKAGGQNAKTKHPNKRRRANFDEATK
jgi:3'-phosphoadenosine 5'-phosphosulfate sulfotransferase (PAPS reductase)/FAD synthetase